MAIIGAACRSEMTSLYLATIVNHLTLAVPLLLLAAVVGG
jgi:hypothetical protein